MRPLLAAATAALATVLLACGASDPVPVAPDAGVTGPQVFFLQVDT